MNLQEIAKQTYRKRPSARNRGFVVYDKKAEKYRKGGASMVLGQTWYDSIDDATIYKTSESAHEAINYMVGEGYNQGSATKNVWWHYYRELDPAGEMPLNWSDVEKYFEIQKVVIQTKVTGTVKLGS